MRKTEQTIEYCTRKWSKLSGALFRQKRQKYFVFFFFILNFRLSEISFEVHLSSLLLASYKLTDSCVLFESGDIQGENNEKGKRDVSHWNADS